MARIKKILICVIRDISGKNILNPLGLNRPVNTLDLMKHRIDRTFRSDELSQCNLRKCIFDDLMQPYDHRPDAAITIVNARIKHPRIAFAVLREHVLIQNPDDLAEANVARRPRQKITALRAAC